MNSQIFLSKILLFGEYGILKNSKAISIPFHKYQGNLEFGDLTDNDVKKSNKSISDFFNFLKKSNQKNNFNIIQFEIDIKKGLFFKSSIPIGYGLGSSGALVAAVYHKYFFNKIQISKDLSSDKLIKLKEIFSQIESYFHKKSSGIDPLNSYVGYPLFIESNDTIAVNYEKDLIFEMMEHHIKISKRQTRSKESWKKNEEMILNDKGFLVKVTYKNKL